MNYPPLVKYQAIDEYRHHYEEMYCRFAVITFDNVAVRFRKDRFDHCFFESSKRNHTKDVFSQLRAERIDWIKAALQDATAELYIGWDRKKKIHDKSHRVAVVVNDYVVVIRLIGKTKASFVTAYVADSKSTLDRIKKSPKWRSDKQKNR